MGWKDLIEVDVRELQVEAVAAQMALKVLAELCGMDPEAFVEKCMDDARSELDGHLLPGAIEEQQRGEGE